MKRQRGRSRNNNHNKSHNPNRAMESNGPGVKVRGAVTTIHEKYQQLARDASLSGDRVMAENYLQFAEHYFRIIRAQQLQREQREEEQNTQRAARQAEYDARKAKQQERNQQPQQDPAPAVQQTEAKPTPTSETVPPGQNNNTGNGTGPMDVVTPKASPATELVTAKPKPAPRRRVRRPVGEKAIPKTTDAVDKPSA